MANLQPPPTWALPVLVDQSTGSVQFHPTWLKWFVDLAATLNGSGGTTTQHNSLSGLQGGTTGQYYHLNAADYALASTHAYGSMYNDGVVTTVAVAAANTWYQVPSGFTTGPTNNITFQNARELKVLTAGTYNVHWGMAASTAVNNQTIEGTVMVNGVANLTVDDDFTTKGANSVSNLSGRGIIALAVNDVVSLCVNNNTAATNIVVDHGDLLLYRIAP